MNRGWMIRKLQPYFFLLPVVLVIGLVMVFPLIYTVFYSFTSKFIGRKIVNYGIFNYINVFREGCFVDSLEKSVLFTVVCVFAKFVIGLSLALMLNKPFKGRNIVKGYFFLPWCIPWYTVAILFLWMFRFSGGINTMLMSVGLSPIFWLSNKWALVSGMIANIWKGFPFFMLSFYAGLQGIPKELYEAAAMDGANTFDKFRYITLPGLRNVILIVSTLSTLWTFALFELIYIMTRGGPGNASKVLPILVYNTGLREYQYGLACAESVLVLPIVLTFVFLLIYLMQKET